MQGTPRATAHRRQRRRHRTMGALAALAVVVPAWLTGCGSSSGSDTAGTSGASTRPSTSSSTSTTAASSSSGPSVTSPTTTEAGGLPDATEGQHSAPADGTGTALLTDVRVGSHDGYERIVFQFRGTTTPGYTIQWVDPPILSDGSGDPVQVDGKAFLQMVFEPASGVDLSAPDLVVTYEGPDRVPTDQLRLVQDLVRTGDFEAVLTWVAGTTEQVPIRVQTLSDPVRVVVDLEAP